MTLSKSRIAVVHIAKTKLNLLDEDYRAILNQVAGVESSKMLSDEGFEAVMFRFSQMGFKSDWNQRNFGYRQGMATPRQIAMIRDLWGTFTEGQGTDASLGRWLDGKFKVSSLRFLPSDTGRKVVGALKIMVKHKTERAAVA
jgi:phage gp16-like protein